MTTQLDLLLDLLETIWNRIYIVYNGNAAGITTTIKCKLVYPYSKLYWLVSPVHCYGGGNFTQLAVATAVGNGVVCLEANSSDTEQTCTS